jgi:hypothetical protein
LDSRGIPRPELTDIWRVFGETGFGLPAVPPQLVSRLSMPAPWHLVSFDVEPLDLYLLKADLLATVLGDPAPRIAVSHSGHGINSSALTYLLTTPRLGLVLQALWGGVYTDPDAARREIRSLFKLSQHLLAAAESSPSWPDGQRIVGVYSSFRRIHTAQVHWFGENALAPETWFDPLEWPGPRAFASALLGLIERAGRPDRI